MANDQVIYSKVPRGTPLNQLVGPDIPVSQGTNRLNSSGQFDPGARNRESVIVTIVIAAGATLPFNVPGTEFYVVQTTAPVNIRPSNGSFNQYVQGTGLFLRPENGFVLVEVQNPNNSAVYLSLFIGFDSFIDRRLILVSQANQPQVMFNDYGSVAGSAAIVTVTDKSNTIQVDSAGTRWFLINRTEIQVFNLDTTVNLYIVGATATTAAAPMGAVYPYTTTGFAYSGTYRVLSDGSTNIKAVISEIYSAVLAP